MIKKQNFLSKEYCSMLIDIHNRYFKQFGSVHRDTNILHMAGDLRKHIIKENEYDNELIRLTEARLNANIQSIDDNCFVNYWQIVQWPEGSSQGWHIDIPWDYGFQDKLLADKNKYTSIAYLNDEYDGGVTLSRTWSNVKETGSIICFNGCEDEHSVTEVTNGTRWTILTFYTRFEK